ncbi:MAG: hypothetical protein WBA10_10465 [Elainellaceae cyanobacterium]
MNDWHRILQRFMHRGLAQRLFRHLRPVLVVLLVIAINISLIGCSSSGGDRVASSRSNARSGPNTLQEVPPPATLQALGKEIDIEPQVRITSPRADETLQDDRVTVRFRVTDFPAFKDKELEMGPHLHVIVDNQPYRAVYDPGEPLILEDLSPGTHTVRAFASRPWHESFKNADAYDQVQFHVFTQTPSLDLDGPLLTYSRPKGEYGTEPVMLDLYLQNVSLPSVVQSDAADAVKDASDWKVRCTINGQAFTFNTWEPIYLEGLKPGKNWVQLELLDKNDEPINSPYNNIARLITVAPNSNDTLSKLMRDELPIEEARAIITPGYKPPAAVPQIESPVTKAPTTDIPTTDTPTTDAPVMEPSEVKGSKKASSSADITIDPPEPASLPKTDVFPPGLLIEETLPEIAPAAPNGTPEPEGQAMPREDNLDSQSAALLTTSDSAERGTEETE